jgi:hypothetical protein
MIPKSIVSDEDRQIGKKFRHAANYDMQKGTAGGKRWSVGVESE